MDQQCFKYNFQQIFQECGGFCRFFRNCALLCWFDQIVQFLAHVLAEAPTLKCRLLAQIIKQTIFKYKIPSIFRRLDLYPTDNLTNILAQRLLLEIFYRRFFHPVYLASDASQFQVTWRIYEYKSSQHEAKLLSI